MTTRLERSVGESGLLFQSHPGIGAWEATRALGPEVAAYRNPNLTAGNRLSLNFYAAGETDEDGYTFQSDTWEIEARGVEGLSEWRFEHFPDRGEAIARLAELMEGNR